ncbi:MAG TPA: VIT and VWA domain-containing protein [Anaeromyxobacter sp.]|nr:VIT and VWA domain-containing protein [Anaeromyxobacter sp.]
MRLRLAAALLALVPVLPLPAAAQVLAPPRLVVRAAERPVTVAALDVRVVIQGLAAETTETITFHNPNGRVLEGELEFPLPDGAAVTGFALDVDGRLAEGVVVPKDEARVVLETEIRRGVDPGVVEQVRGNVHRARVYPIPARGARTVQLRWLSPLAVAGTRERPEAAYHLPLPYRERLPEVALRVEVIRPPLTPRVAGGSGNLTFARQSDRWVAEERLANAPADRDLLVRLPLQPARSVDVEVTGGEAFFSVLEPAPPVPVDDRRRPAGPRRIALAWDASASRTPAATEKELAFLRQLHAEWSETAVDLVVFRDRPERPVAFAARDWAKLEAALRAAPADGGTALAALDLRRAALPHPDDALWLLMSDGLVTLGESLPATDDVPVHAVTGATEADRALLRHLARTSGGVFVEAAARPARQAFATVRDAGYRFAPVTGSPAGAVADLHVGETEQGWVRVTGRLLAPEARLTLASRSLQGEQRREITIRRADAARAFDRPGPVAISWAQAQAEVLGLFPTGTPARSSRSGAASAS